MSQSAPACAQDSGICRSVAGPCVCQSAAILPALLALAMAATAQTPAHAQKFESRYAISMTGIRVGQSAWTITFEEDHYSIKASGGSVDIVNVLMRGEGTAESAGMVKEGRLMPASFSSSLIEEGKKIDLKMTLSDGTVTNVEDNAPPPEPDRVPVTDANLREVSDPLSALLIPNDAADGVMAKEACERTLAIFDGRRRYDLALSFKRMGEVHQKEYAGNVLVCNVVLNPIAGHRANSMIMKYVASRRDMEVAFVPIAGTAFLAPFRLTVPTLVGTMTIYTTALKWTAAAPPPAPKAE
jgi:hypothetical protein